MSGKRFSRKDVKILEDKPLYRGFFSMDAVTFKHRLFGGGWSQDVTREVFERGDAVAVLPYDPVRDEIVLIEQIRIPALKSSATPWLLELVAGMMAPEESPEAVAHKELQEETGLKTQRLERISNYLTSPGGTTERIHFYWAQVDATKAMGVHGLEHEHEDIRVLVLSRDEAYARMLAGKIDNATAIIGLQWLELNYKTLQTTAKG